MSPGGKLHRARVLLLSLHVVDEFRYGAVDDVGGQYAYEAFDKGVAVDQFLHGRFDVGGVKVLPGAIPAMA